MNDNLRQKLESASLTKDDVLDILVWQLSLPAEQIDCDLISECDLFLDPDSRGMDAARRQQMQDIIMAYARGVKTVRSAHRTAHRRRMTGRRMLIAVLALLMLLALTVGAVAYFVRRGVLNFNDDWGWLAPLTYQEGSLLYYQNGVLQPTPFVSDTSPLTVNGLGIPAGGTAMLIYTVNVNEFAPPAGVITNTATLVVPEGNEVTATETITGECEASLSIVKGISPSTICESGTITYTFTIYNSGSTAITAEDGVVVEDLFDPALSNLTVTINGVSRTGDPTAYTYNASTGAFATLPGVVTVPAATYTQDPVTGAYTVTPGETEIVITGTIGA